MSMTHATPAAPHDRPPLRNWLVIGAVALLVASCSGGDSGSAVSSGPPATATGGALTGISASDLAELTRAGPTVRATATTITFPPVAGDVTIKVTPEGGNLLTLNGAWANADGSAAAPFDGVAGRLLLAPGATIFTRGAASLVAGTRYRLTSESSVVGTEVSLTLLNAANQAIKLNGQTIAGDDVVSFTAPADVRGYYVSVANRSGESIQALADLRGDQSATAPAPGATRPPTTDSPPAAGLIVLDPVAQSSVPDTDDLRPARYTELVPGASDEFDGTALDLSKWCTRMTWGGSNVPLGYPDAECTKWPSMGVGDFAQEHENQRFREFNSLGEPLHVVSEGTLKLRATNTSDREYQPFESSAIRSKFTFKPSGTESYYIAARVYMQDIRGTLPTIWLNPGLDPSPDSGAGGVPHTIPEIDIFEAALNYEAEDPFSMHQGTQVDGAQTATGTQDYSFTHPRYNRQWQYWDGTEVGVNLRDRWIRMGTEWNANEVCFYIEGMKTNCQRYQWVLADGQPAHPATLIAYYAIGGNWAGRTGIDRAKFPSAFEIDYLRVYKSAN